MAVQPDGDTSDALHLRSDASDKLDSVTRRYSMSASLATVGPDADMEIPKPSSILPADADVPRQIPDATSTPSTPSLVSTGSTTPGYICDGNSPCLDLDAIRWQEKVPVPEKGDDASSNKSNTRLDSMAIDKVGHEHEKRFTGGCLGMNEDDSAEARTFDDEA